jgi:putative FmdB family regulatory protein
VPLYDYECEECGSKFELRRGITEPEGEVQCPVCGEMECHRVFSGFSFAAAGGSSSCAPAPGRKFG